MVGWHHWFNGHKFEQNPRDSDGQGNLVCYNPWGHQESYTTEGLENNDTDESEVEQHWSQTPFC